MIKKIIVSAKQHHQALIKYKGVLRSDENKQIRFYSDTNPDTVIEYHSLLSGVGATTDPINTVL